MSSRARLVLVAVAVAAAPLPVLAQGGVGSVSTVEGDVNGRALDARDRRMMARICWQRQDAAGPEWMADHNPDYRRTVLSRYVIERDGPDWRWLPAESVRTGDLRASGYTDRVVEVRPDDDGTGRARLAVAGPLREGVVTFEWTVPPRRVCMLDALELRAEVTVEEGDPGEAGISFLLPMSREMLAAEGAEVKACNPRSATLVDVAGGLLHDEGECRRSLFHLTEGAGWAIWVSLPESAWVVYPYRPVAR